MARVFVMAQLTTKAAERFLRRVLVPHHHFRRLPQLQGSPDGFLRFYNHELPHHGYRTRGRPPAALFLGARA